MSSKISGVFSKTSNKETREQTSANQQEYLVDKKLTLIPNLKRKISKKPKNNKVSQKKAKKNQNNDNVHTTIKHNTPFTLASYQYPSFVENLDQISGNNDDTGDVIISNVEVKQNKNIELDFTHDFIPDVKIKIEPQIDVENCVTDEMNSSLSVEESLRKIYSLQKCLESSLNNEMGL